MKGCICHEREYLPLCKGKGTTYLSLCVGEPLSESWTNVNKCLPNLRQKSVSQLILTDIKDSRWPHHSDSLSFIKTTKQLKLANLHSYQARLKKPKPSVTEASSIWRQRIPQFGRCREMQLCWNTHGLKSGLNGQNFKICVEKPNMFFV